VLNNTNLEIVQETCYLGVILQSDLEFNKHIQSKIGKAKNSWAWLKHTLHYALASSRLLAYSSLCRPHIEYAASVWDTSLDYQINGIEIVQHETIRFISTFKGRDSVTAAHEELELENLADITKTSHAPLLHLLSQEQKHKWVTSAYDELINDRPNPDGPYWYKKAKKENKSTQLPPNL